MAKIEKFTQQYPASRYAYSLRKNFILGIGLAYRDQVDLKLDANSAKLQQHIEETLKSSHFAQDSIEEKEHLMGAIKLILVNFLLKVADTVQSSSLKLNEATISQIEPSLISANT